MQRQFWTFLTFSIRPSKKIVRAKRHVCEFLFQFQNEPTMKLSRIVLILLLALGLLGSTGAIKSPPRKLTAEEKQQRDSEAHERYLAAAARRKHLSPFVQRSTLFRSFYEPQNRIIAFRQFHSR